jgi:GxxExxY protein
VRKGKLRGLGFMTENEIAKIVVDLCVKIHKILGPGLLESVYEAALVYELKKLGIPVEQQIGIPVEYDHLHLDIGFRADLIIEKKVIVELKSIETVLPVHKKQLLTYLKLSKFKLGLLTNFNVDLMKDGITRIANGL